MTIIDEQFLNRSKQILIKLQSEYEILLSKLTTARYSEFDEIQKQIEYNLEQQRMITEYLRSSH